MEIGQLVKRAVVTVGPGHTLAEAAQRMTDRNVGAAVVLFDDEGPGIISERDILRAIAGGCDLRSATVGDHMTSKAVVGSSSWDVNRAARTMIAGGFRHLVVVDQGSELGILSIRDLVEVLVPESE